MEDDLHFRLLINSNPHDIAAAHTSSRCIPPRVECSSRLKTKT